MILYISPPRDGKVDPRTSPTGIMRQFDALPGIDGAAQKAGRVRAALNSVGTFKERKLTAPAEEEKRLAMRLLKGDLSDEQVLDAAMRLTELRNPSGSYAKVLDLAERAIVVDAVGAMVKVDWFGIVRPRVTALVRGLEEFSSEFSEHLPWGRQDLVDGAMSRWSNATKSAWLQASDLLAELEAIYEFCRTLLNAGIVPAAGALEAWSEDGGKSVSFEVFCHGRVDRLDPAERLAPALTLFLDALRRGSEPGLLDADDVLAAKHEIEAEEAHRREQEAEVDDLALAKAHRARQRSARHPGSVDVVDVSGL